jgi:PPK2 family polyphosphate:nucleotide phosphotransferase
MTSFKNILDAVRVRPGKKVRLKDHDAAWAGDKKTPKAERKAFAEEQLTASLEALAASQDKLYAADGYAILIVLQAMDAAGKDSTIKHVMTGVNPQGCQVFSFKQPSVEEVQHDYFWRYAKCLPERGRIGIFNRSYYEEVLVVKVHPKLVNAERLLDAKVNDKFWQGRYEDINAFERHLARNGTVVLKFFLNVSKDEQRKRFLERLDNPDKHWKFSDADLAERGYWDDYMRAYEECLSATSSDWAPWHVIPANHKWVSRALVAHIVAATIESLDLKYPEVTPEKRKQIAAARKQLDAEGEK